MNSIIVQNVKKSFGQTSVLNGVNFEIVDETQVSLVGMSGSGKSTLLYILGGLDKPDSGAVLIDSHEITKMQDEELALFRNSDVGFVFQFHYLLPSLSCLDNLLLPAKIGGRNLSEVKTYVLELAKTLGVTHCLSKFPFEISGGEQQRINIIRAVSLSPKLILCDEPTGSLDSKNSKIVIDLLKDISTRINATLVVVTHDNDIAGQFQRKITIEDGLIIG
jgi:ABC-type lipoprotein export system ATPase subunit